jgi:c-di-GMP-binding flagellar brake protein YcgR
MAENEKNSQVENLIEFKDSTTVNKHLQRLFETKQNCIIITDKKSKIPANFQTEKEGIITFIPLVMYDESLAVNDEIRIEYQLDKILHSFTSKITGIQPNKIEIAKPDEVHRYQIRRFKRIYLDKKDEVKVSFQLLSRIQECLEVADLSEGGIGLHIHDVPGNIDKDIRVNSIKLMLKDRDTLHISGRLRYIKTLDKDGNARFRLGIEFDPLQENERLSLLDFINTVSKRRI